MPALAAREERHGLRTLPRGARDDVDAALERILRVLEKDEPRLAAAEQLREHRLEVLVRLLEGLPEEVARSEVEVVDELEYLGLRGEEILLLRLLARIALLELAALVYRDHVHRTERGDLGLQPVDLALKLLHRRHDAVLPLGVRLAQDRVREEPVLVLKVVVDVLAAHRGLRRRDLELAAEVARLVELRALLRDVSVNGRDLLEHVLPVRALLLHRRAAVRRSGLELLELTEEIAGLLLEPFYGLVVAPDAL